MSGAADLRARYQAYLDCLNARSWSELGDFVDDEVRYNGRPVGLATYREQREAEARDIPDLRYDIELLVCEPPHISARLRFDCTPSGDFLGLPVRGRRIRFTENVIYRCTETKITDVWSVIDKTAVEAQLRDS